MTGTAAHASTQHSAAGRRSHAVAPDTHILDEFPLESSFDVVVVGGGPNGLMTAAYLARAGLSTIVVERRHEIGGGLATEETLFPGYYTNPHAVYHMMTDYMPVLRDFEMSEHGLTFVTPNAQTAMVYPDGSSLLLCRQIEDSKDSISKFSPSDARRFGQVMRRWRRLIDGVVAPGTYVPPLHPLDMIEAFERTEDGRELLRLTELSPTEIVHEIVEHPRVRALLLYAACMWGLDPDETGLGFLVPLLIDRSTHKAVCYGGSHKFAGALSRQILQAGGSILDNSEVTGLLVENGTVTGVECFDGRVIHAKAVVSSLPPPMTFGSLMDPAAVPDDLSRVAEDWEWEHWSFFTASIATTEAPHYECDDPWVDDAFMVVTGFDSDDDVYAYFEASMRGEIPAVTGGHATVESRYDPTLPRVPGHHVSFFQTHVPYEPAGGWKQHHDDFVLRLLDHWGTYASNVNGDTIILATGESPLDIETRLPNMVRGSIKHGAYQSLQMGVFRPHDSCIGGRTPIEGLYLCGASSYPGGLVIGGPGYIAAGAVADDLDVSRWWTTPRFVKRYEDTYLT